MSRDDRQAELSHKLQAAIDSDDFELAKQAIAEGAEVKNLYIYAIQNLSDTKILELLLENGFNIHAEKNMILSEWMGSSLISGGESWKSAKYELLAFVFEYYLDKPNAIEKFQTLRVSDKKRLFLIGLYSNNFTLMKFAIMIGAEKNEALNTAHRQYHAYKKGEIGSIYSLVYENNKEGAVDYKIVEYILHSGIRLNKTTISRAVCFDYKDILNAISHKEDLEYGYEMAYSYEKEDICEYFVNKGVAKQAQTLAKMRVSAIKGDIKELRTALDAGADISALHRADIVQIINKNQTESLQLLCEAGLVVESSLNKHLSEAVSLYKAYETVTFLIERGLDANSIKNIPQEYKRRYPIIADMCQRGVGDIFDYTKYLAKELYPNIEGKEKEQTLQRIAQLSALPYVKQKSQEQSHE